MTTQEPFNEAKYHADRELKRQDEIATLMRLHAVSKLRTLPDVKDRIVEIAEFQLTRDFYPQAVQVNDLNRRVGRCLKPLGITLSEVIADLQLERRIITVIDDGSICGSNRTYIIGAKGFNEHLNHAPESERETVRRNLYRSFIGQSQTSMG